MSSANSMFSIYKQVQSWDIVESVKIAHKKAIYNQTRSADDMFSIHKQVQSWDTVELAEIAHKKLVINSSQIC